MNSMCPFLGSGATSGGESSPGGSERSSQLKTCVSPADSLFGCLVLPVQWLKTTGPAGVWQYFTLGETGTTNGRPRSGSGRAESKRPSIPRPRHHRAPMAQSRQPLVDGQTSKDYDATMQRGIAKQSTRRGIRVRRTVGR